MRLAHPNLHRRKFFQDRRIDPEAPDRQVDGGVEGDILWLLPDGKEMTQQEWNAGWVRCIGLLLNGRTLDDVNAVGEPILDSSFLLLFNPHHEPIRFTLPKPRPGMVWRLLIDTRVPAVDPAHKNRFRRFFPMIERSLSVFQEVSF